MEKAINIDVINKWFESLSFDEKVQLSILHLGHGNVDMLDDKDLVHLYIDAVAINQFKS